MAESGGQADSRWEDALRTAQDELDALRDKHARERQRLEQHFHSGSSNNGASEEAPTQELPVVESEDAELLEPPVEGVAGIDERKATYGESGADVLRLHERLIKANDKLSRQNEQFAALRAAHNRLLASEGKYREKADTLAVHYQQAIDEVRHLHTSNQHTHHSQHHIRSQIAALTTEFKAMELALLDKTQQQADGRSEMAARDDEWRRERAGLEERWRRKKAEWRRREAEMGREQAERERVMKELMVSQAEERDEEVRRAEERAAAVEAEMKELSAKHRDECRRKEEQLYEASEQIQGFEAAIERLQLDNKHLDSLRTECSRLDLEIHRLRATHAAELKEAQRIQETVEGAAQQRQALVEREKQSMQQLVQQCEKQIQQLADSVAARDKQVKQSKADCRDRDESISHLQLQIAALRETAETADEAHNRELRAMQEELDGYRDEHASIVAELEKQRAQQREHVQAAIVLLLNPVDGGSREADKENVVTERDSKAQQAVTMLQAMLQSDAQHTAPLSLHRATHSAMRKSHPSPARPLPGRRSSSTKGHDRRHQQRPLLPQQQRDTDDSSDNSLPSTHVVTLGARISHLQLQLAHAQEQLNTQQQHAAFLAAQLNTLQQDKTTLSTQLHALQRQHASDKQQAKRREQELQAQLSQLQASQRSEQQWSELQSDVDACKQAVKAAREELQRKMRLLMAAQQEQQRLEARSKQLEEDIVQRDKRASKLQRQCQAKEAAVAQLQEEVRGLEARQSQTREMEETVRLEVEQLRGVLTRSQQEVTELHDAVMEKELQIAALRREKSETEKQLSESQALVDRQVVELHLWRTKEQETKSTLAHTLSQLEEVKHQLSSCQVEQVDLQRRLAELHARFSAHTQQQRQRAQQRRQQQKDAERRKRQRAGLDVSAVSEAAAEVGLDFSLEEVEELINATDALDADGRADAEENKQEDERRQEERKQAEFVQQVKREWQERVVAPLAATPAVPTASWLAALSAALLGLAEEEVRVEKLLLPGLTERERARSGDDPQTVWSRYEAIIAQVKQELMQQHREHTTAVLRYQKSISQLTDRLSRCRCQKADSGTRIRM